MKKLALILTLTLALNAGYSRAQKQLKRYELKSGIVEYETTISGKVLGSTISGSGYEKLYFKDWGAVELKESQSAKTSTMKFFGKKKTETEKSHEMNKLDNGKTYSVDFDQQQIYASRDMAMDMTTSFHPDADAGDVGKNMLESMGGQKIGNEEFMGYDCEIWELAGGKQWMYKGVMLKLEMTALGITTVTQATSVDFNTTVADKYFQLPDFPIEQEEGFMDDDMNANDAEEMDAAMEKISKMSYAEWKKFAVENDDELREMSEEDLRYTYDSIQKMIKMRTGK